MGKLVLFNLMDGSLEEGFSIGVTVYDEDSRKILNKVHGKLAANSDLENKYLSWQIPYRKLINDWHTSRMPIEGIDRESEIENDRTHLISEISAANKQLNETINDWLKREGEFSTVCTEIDRTLKNENEEIRLIVDTKSTELQKIPFFLWKEFFTHYHRAEVGLYLPVKNSIENNNKDKVKILAVFGSKEFIGNNTQVRIDNDWEIIKNHLSTKSNADLIRLQEPTLDELGDNIEVHCPQILFFAGHSFSNKNSREGQIKLNQHEYVTIDDLKYDLRKAAKKGLKLAIFNSCDGMGIARQLEDIGISNIIVMREPVPDEVAHRFLRRFLERFAFGRSINLAVRRGREKLQRLEKKYPGVVCLPVLWQNPAEAPLTWEQLGGITTNKNNQKSVLWQSTEIQHSDISPQSSEYAGNLVNSNLSESKNNREENSKVLESSKRIPNLNTTDNSDNLVNNHSVCQNSFELIGKTLANRYKIIEKIGGGGFGETYLAIDIYIPSQLQCVVKRLSVFNNDAQMNSVAKRLFETEAKSLFKLGEYSFIPRLHAYFSEDDNFYLVQEFIDGRDLSSEFQIGHKWSEHNTINFLQELLEILVFVHQHGNIHRDIKPSNIIRRRKDNRLVLIDFGAVKEVITSNTSQENTNVTIAIGTSDYSPPEQLRGKPGKYSDIYTVGMLGIQALTGLSPGELPKDSEDLFKMWHQHRNHISPQLKEFLNRMVSFEYQNRFPNAREALESLPPPIVEQSKMFKIQLFFTKKYLILTTALLVSISLVTYYTRTSVINIPIIFQDSQDK